jgi:methylated-DNA-protein-cysteine methyltransferase-like protein
MPRTPEPESSYDRIYAVVARIPRGRVATYGQVATLAGIPNGARQVGYALAALNSGSRLPWHRVVNAAGSVSLRAPGAADQQRFQLEKEGVRFNAAGRVDLRLNQWDGMNSKQRAR